MAVLIEGQHKNGFILGEDAGGMISRDAKVLAVGQNLKAGTVLGIIALGAASAAIKGSGNTGNGVFTIDATNPVRPGAKAGVYQVRCITAAANGGAFRIEDPDGFVLGDVAVAATFDDDIKFSIADGAADFVVGDGFDVTVSAGSGKVTQLNPAAFDGSQAAACILCESTDATAADQACAVVARLTRVFAAELIWPAGITPPQKAAATAQLTALNILLR